MKEFIDIRGYEGYYQINEDGIVRSVDRLVHNRYGDKTRRRRGNILSTKARDKDGYTIVTLSINGVVKTYKLHRLLAIAFIQNPENKPEINHINGIKDDNKISNLEWATQSEQQFHAIKIGLRKPLPKEKTGGFGKVRGLNPNSKLVLDLQTGIYYDSAIDAADAKGLKCNSNFYSQLNGWLPNKIDLIYA